MDTLRQDLRYALRSLRRSPGFTLVAALTLALGIGATTAIFSIVDGTLLRPLPYPHPDRLVFISSTTPGQEGGSMSGPQFLDIAHDTRSFAALTAIWHTSPTLTGLGDAQRLAAEVVSPDYFRVFGIAPLLGRTFGAATAGAAETRQAVLSWDLWRARFAGDPGIVGRILRLDGQAYAVVGVMPRGFRGEVRNGQIWLLARRDVPDAPTFGAQRDLEHNRGTRYLDVLARLRPGVTLQRAGAELRGLGTRLGQTYPDTDAGITLGIRSWRDLLVGDTRRPLLILLAAVGVVLLIACANLANLLLVRGTARQREITIRSALGASRGRLARQLLTEGLVLSIIAGLAGVALAYGSVGPARALVPSWAAQTIDFSLVSVDARVLLFALAISLLTGLLAGLAPSLSAVRVELSRGLREGSRGSTEGKERHRLRAAFVGAQVALALVLLTSAGLLLRSLDRLTATNPGFDRTRVLTVQLELPQARYDAPHMVGFYDQVQERLRGLPGVQAAGVVFPLPLEGTTASGGFVVEGRPAPRPNQQQMAAIVWASGDYFRALRIPLREGRLFDRRDAPAAPGVLLVNDAMARRYWPGQNPVGARVKLAADPADTTSPWMTVVGVVGSVRPASLGLAPGPELYLPLSQNAWASMTIVLRGATGDPERLLPAVRREISGLDRDLALGTARTLDTVVEQSVARPRFRSVLLGSFALLALILAAIGIYGVISFGVTQRRPEIGVRLALGATPGDVRRLVVGQGLRPVLIGVALGLVAALAAAGALASLLYQVSAWDPITFLAVPALLAAIAVAASWLPACRAAAVDPMTSLRTE